MSWFSKEIASVEAWFSSEDKGQQGIKGINNGQSLLSIVRRDEQDRKARVIGERTCIWRSRLASPCIPERFTIKV